MTDAATFSRRSPSLLLTIQCMSVLQLQRLVFLEDVVGSWEVRFLRVDAGPGGVVLDPLLWQVGWGVGRPESS